MAYKRKRPIDLLTRDDLDTLLAANSNHSITATRNRALLSVLFFSGVRIQEALDLRPVDHHVKADGSATLNIRSGKGDKQRITTLAAPGVPDLQAWLTLRNSRVTASYRSAPVFCTHTVTAPGRPLSQAYVRAWLARLQEQTNIRKRLHAHTFRHAHASYLFHRGVPIAAIQTQLGHSTPLTTMRYLASIGAHDAHRHVANAFV